MIFIAAYDRPYLINAISDINDHKSERFLEKIFQVEISLPMFGDEIIINSIYKLLDPFLTQEDNEIIHNHLKSIIEEQIWGNDQKVQMYTGTLRDITRFANSFLLAYSNLKGEIDVKELYYLELIKLKYPLILELFFKHKDDFLTKKKDFNNLDLNSIYYLKKYITETGSSDFEIKRYLENKDISKQYKLSDKDIDTIISLLNNIFTDISKPFYIVNILSIRIPLNFDKYTFYDVPIYRLSQNEFNRSMNKNIDDLKSDIDTWVEKGFKNEILKRFQSRTHFSNKEDYEKTINAVILLAKNHNNSDNLNERVLLKRLFTYADINNIYADINKYILFIKNIFENAESPYCFEFHFIRQIINNNDFFKIIEKEFFEGMAYNYYLKYLNKANSVDTHLFDLFCFSNSTYKEYIKENRLQDSFFEGVNPKDLVVDFIKKRGKDFLEKYIAKGPELNKYKFLQGMERVFSTYDDFDNFIESQKAEVFYEEIKAFYTKIKAAKYEPVDFDFKTLTIRDDLNSLET